MTTPIRMTKKTRAALLYIREWGATQECCSDYDKQFERLLAAGYLKRTENIHGERTYWFTVAGDNLAWSVSHDD